jgi:hypothetical protein
MAFCNRIDGNLVKFLISIFFYLWVSKTSKFKHGKNTVAAKNDFVAI